MLSTALPLLLQTTLLLQTPPIMPRDTVQPAKPGTAAIRGRVTAADTGLPLRRAVVTLMGGSPGAGASGPRTLATDTEGRFAFTRLPAGTYRLRVSPGSYRGQYLTLNFGGNRPSDSGQPIELKDGQRLDGADIPLPRGAAITGRVVDEFGEPIARAQVYPSRVIPGSTRFQRTGGGSQTDDLGRFRVYGLEPGEYIITAEAREWGGPPPEGPSEGFAITHFPSALTEAEGSRVRVASSDVGDFDIVLVRTRTFRITGMILDSQGRPVAPMGAQLVRASGSGFNSFGISGQDESGRFTIRNVVPGDYRLVVRPVSFARNQPQPSPAASREFANVPLSVTSDIEDLVIVTQPGVSIAGRISFAEEAPPKPPSGLRVFAQSADRTGSFGGTPNATVDASLQFRLDDLFEKQFIRLSGLPPRYAVKAIMLGQTDITDTALEFKPEHTKHLEIVVTSRVSTLEGTVTDDKGEPAENVVIFAIPEDKASWNRGSPRLRLSGTQKPGQFSIGNMLPGRYYVAAVYRDHGLFLPETGPEFFESLMKDATMVFVGEDEKRTLDLRVMPGTQER